MLEVRGKRLAVALGGGGARGCAHIGVLDELCDRGGEIVAVAGTSMGAVVGGLYAVGRLQEYEEWLAALTHRDVLRMLDLSPRSPGMIGGDKVMARIRELIGDVRIEELPIPFTAIATDLLSGREVWFQSGPLETAIRASIALPSVITPLYHDGLVLADGGLINLVPITPLAAARADLVIAVSVGGAPTGHALPRAADAVDAARAEAIQQRDMDILQRIKARLGWERTTPTEPVVADVPVSVRTLDVMELSLQAMQRMITRYQMANNPVDCFIELPVDACGTMEFHRAKYMVELGRSTARRVLDGADAQGSMSAETL